jgi:hypothetical protein
LNKDGVILFHTTAMVMKAEKALTRAGYPVKLIPTPRQFSSDCGIALQFTVVSRETVIEALQKNGVEIASLHEL